MGQEVFHPDGGHVPQLGPAVKLSATPAAIRRPAPRVGQHTREILSELGYDQEKIQSLACDGIVAIHIPENDS